jgi:adenine-specific DNA-methyltransferase
VPLTTEFLKANPFLVLDTKFFGQDFKDRLLASFENLDEQTNGLLIHSENFQTLTLLQRRYTGQVKCIYIDPPYNTGVDGFVYKDNYQHSSWATMLGDRLSLAASLMRPDGVLFCNIDENEDELCRNVLSSVFGRDACLGTIVWKKRGGAPNDRAMASVHDSIFVYRHPEGKAGLSLLPRPEDSIARYTNPDNDPNGAWVPGDLSANAKGGRFVPSLYFEIVNPVTAQRHLPPEGACWRFNKEKVERLIAEGKIFFGSNGQGRPKLKRYLNEVRDGITIPSIWDSLATNTNARAEINALFGENNAFDTVKPVRLIRQIAYIGGTGNGIVLDFFAGSGTTGHAVINLNREDAGKRKYILAEMGEYFETVLKPRIQKVIYSKEWKNGRPTSAEGTSHLFKYIRLESYEDALNNIEMRRTMEQASLLEAHDEFRENYMLRYMLDVEAGGSASLLNVEGFADPFNYQLHVATGASAGETRPVAVDLVETFNYLLGLRGRRIEAVCGFRVVKGTNPEGEQVLIIWRNTREKSNDDLDQFFRQQGYNTRDREFDLIYTNGDNNLGNLRRPDATWKVRLIEESFQRLMFDVRDV